MERLIDRRWAAWLVLCLGAGVGGAALFVPAWTVIRHHNAPGAPTPHVTLAPRTHLFGEPVTATLDLQAGATVKAAFAPYQVVSRTVTRRGTEVRYRFVLDCLRSACVGLPDSERQVRLRPVTIGLPGGRTMVRALPPIVQASRLGLWDLGNPMLRGELATPDRPGGGGHRLLVGLPLAVVAELALCAAGWLGLRRLRWRPEHFPPLNGRQPSDLEYALLVTGLSAGGDAEDRRAALESLAVALDGRGLADLATSARRLAWSPGRPTGESVRMLAKNARRAAGGRA